MAVDQQQQCRDIGDQWVHTGPNKALMNHQDSMEQPGEEES